jgi:hypothetical protein
LRSLCRFYAPGGHTRLLSTTGKEEIWMKLMVLSVLLALTAAVLTATAVAGSTAGAPPCVPKVKKVKGHEEAISCGPATATLRIGGKSYTFRHGFCQQSLKQGAALLLDLGTVVVGAKGNAGQAYLSMTVGKVHTIASVSEADFGGKQLTGTALIVVAGKIPGAGTFKSRFGTPSFTGSWNCHGVVYSSP